MDELSMFRGGGAEKSAHKKPDPLQAKASNRGQLEFPVGHGKRDAVLHTNSSRNIVTVLTGAAEEVQCGTAYKCPSTKYSVPI